MLLLYDSDEAGVKAALRAIPILREAREFQSGECIFSQDPDEFIKAEGAEAFEKRLEAATDSFMFRISIASGDFPMDEPQGLNRFFERCAQYLLELSDELGKNSVTPIKIRPRNGCQYSGIMTVNQTFSAVHQYGAKYRANQHDSGHAWTGTDDPFPFDENDPAFEVFQAHSRTQVVESRVISEQVAGFRLHYQRRRLHPDQCPCRRWRRRSCNTP